MTAGVPALALLAAAVAGWSPRDAPVRARLRRLARASARQRDPGRPVVPGSARLRRHVLPAVLAAATALLAGGPGGLLLGLLVGGGAGWLLHRARGPDSGRGNLSAAASRELPVACDLLAVCLAAGVPVGPALAAVGQAVAEPLRAHLLEVAALYRLGADPAHAWSGAPSALASLGRTVSRAGTSGSAVGAALRALAADLRATERARGEAAVHRAGVWVLAPLGACFLPAFVCLGVVPLVLGLAAGVLG